MNPTTLRLELMVSRMDEMELEPRWGPSQEELCVALTGVLRAQESLGDLVRDQHCKKTAQNVRVIGRLQGNKTKDR